MHPRARLGCDNWKLTPLGLLALVVFCGAGATVRADKSVAVKSVDAQSDELWKMARQIWDWAEPGYQEVKSAKLLADHLEAAGFNVERGVADIPTAFTATFGSGKPVIAILGEYDALPGLAQEATPERRPRAGSANGQACGHHLFGVASAGAAIAIAERIRAGELQGTLRYYGCPAEEGGAGKVFMARAGLFADCDVALHWHPASRNAAGDATSLARIGAKFRFRGASAHAASAAEQGRSALDAVELTAHASELLREHTPEFTRIHHVITSGGGAPNVVPEFAEIYYYVRHPKADVVREIYARLVKCAEGCATATGTKLEIDYLGGTYELLPNDVLSRITLANLKSLNDLRFDDDEKKFAARIQSTLHEPRPLESIGEVTDTKGSQGKGSTDVGDVSWLVPTTGFSTACWAPGTPGHSWQAVAAGGTSIGRKGMMLAARVLAATAYDLFQQPRSIAAAQEEHRGRLGQHAYRSLLSPGQKAPLDYRRAPVAAPLAE